MKGFWVMGACRLSEAPRETKPFNSFWACFATSFRKLNGPAVQDGIGVGLHERRQGDKRIFDADARVVFIVLIENDAGNAVGIGGGGEGSAVVEEENNGVAENP